MMDTYDSDSDLDDQASGVSTSVLLGYASQEPTDDTISQLGGEPIWINSSQPPSASLAQCKTCHSPMSLLLQLNGELPDRFPGHERRLYIWTCRRKACRRKPGSVRALRATRTSKTDTAAPKVSAEKAKAQPSAQEIPKADIGATLFGAKPAATGGNPFSAGNPFSSTSSSGTNPFSSAPGPASSLAAKAPQSLAADDLSQTFADKARISPNSPTTSTAPAPAPTPHIPWPAPGAGAAAFPHFSLDADYEWLAGADDPAAAQKEKSMHHAAFMDVDPAEGSSSAGTSKEDKLLYEDAIDKTFQRFADTLAQNPEQVLRYEFGGAPLLYSRTDAVGVQLLGPPHAGTDGGVKVAAAGAKGAMPRCEWCGAERVFEVQLTPHAITELEEGELSLGEGMEWGTVVMGVCGKDCIGDEGGEGKVVYREEWVGVQWEEVVERQRK